MLLLAIISDEVFEVLVALAFVGRVFCYLDYNFQLTHL